MVLRRLLYNLLNNPQLIEKLSESRAIRRGAQITAFAITKAQLTGQDTIERLLRSNTVQQLQQGQDLRQVVRKMERFKDTFIKEVRTGLKRPGGK